MRAADALDSLGPQLELLLDRHLGSSSSETLATLKTSFRSLLGLSPVVRGPAGESDLDWLELRLTTLTGDLDTVERRLGEVQDRLQGRGAPSDEGTSDGAPVIGTAPFPALPRTDRTAPSWRPTGAGSSAPPQPRGDRSAVGPPATRLATGAQPRVPTRVGRANLLEQLVDENLALRRQPGPAVVGT